MKGSARGNGTVLYVDDEDSDLFFMQKAFKQAGWPHVLQTVGNGREAIDYLAGNGVYADRERHPLPSVVLLDLNLPLVSGFAVLQWIRERPELSTLPVIIFSSSTRAEDKVKSAELGANEYVAKPGSALQFADVVRRLGERWLSLRPQRKPGH